MFAISLHVQEVTRQFPVKAIKKRMQEVLKSTCSEIDGIIDYLLESSGKMLRPRLVYQSAVLYPHDIKKVIDISAAVELIHLASLLHDDVIDNARIRRNRISVNYCWGNQASVLTGDYLFAAAFKLVNIHKLDDVMHNVTSTIQTMCTGEIKQLSMISNLDINEEEYYDKSYRKTACLFASSCRVGALTAKAPERDIEILEKFGANLGYAYQLIDDVLDFVADESELGKPVGSDLSQGNITLPIILALRDSDKGSKLRGLLENGRSRPEMLPYIVDLLIESGAISECVKKSRLFLQEAMEQLIQLPASPARESLQETALYLMDTYYQRLGKLDSGRAVGDHV